MQTHREGGPATMKSEQHMHEDEHHHHHKLDCPPELLSPKRKPVGLLLDFGIHCISREDSPARDEHVTLVVPTNRRWTLQTQGEC